MRLLREFLYVDVPKVRGLLAQLDQGITESTVRSESNLKATGAGVKGVISHQADWGSVSQETKTLGDSLFPTLEVALENEGLLTDISEELTSAEYWNSGELQETFPAGSIIRITSPGHLFDSRFVARTFANFAATSVGLQNLDAIDSVVTPVPPVPPKAKKPGVNSKGPKQAKRAVDAEWREAPIEAEIPADLSVWNGDITGRSLRGMIQVSRGVYSPGIYLNLSPSVEKSYVVSARLEEGRSYLDSTPDVLFARYGVGTQYWTLVGSVGHHGSTREERDFSQGDFMEGEKIVRSSFSEYVNDFMRLLGGLGFADLVQPPGFSVVPIGVYRVLNPRGFDSDQLPAPI